MMSAIDELKAKYPGANAWQFVAEEFEVVEIL